VNLPGSTGQEVRSTAAKYRSDPLSGAFGIIGRVRPSVNTLRAATARSSGRSSHAYGLTATLTATRLISASPIRDRGARFHAHTDVGVRQETARADLRVRRSTSSLLVHATAFAATAIEEGAQGSLSKIHPI
jgi:hypothetical protein